MGVKVATTSTSHQWVAHPTVHHSSSLSQTLASYAVSRRRSIGNDGRSISCRSVVQSQRVLNPSSLFGTPSTKLKHSKSCELWESSRSNKTQMIRRAFSASIDPFSEEEFSKKMQELALKFQDSNEEDEDDESEKTIRRSHSFSIMEGVEKHNPRSDSMEPPWPEMVQMSSIERKANSVDLPLSLRIIKRKLQMEEGVKQVGESACCSVKRAFSSMVFMIRELQSFTLHMRELLRFEDLQGILHRVRKEMHASFVWLFQQVFSATPTLMVSVMILLANFTVYSIGSNSALAAVATPPTTTTVSFSFESSELKETDNFDSSMIKSFSVSSPTGKTSFIGGGGGNNIPPPPVNSGTEGDGSDQFRIPSQFSSSSLGATSADSDVSISGQEEIRLWKLILEESGKMELLDHDTMKQMVSPVEARIEAEKSMDNFKTELFYQTGLSQEPENVLLLANYAQFLYLIIHDYDRAEKYFKRAAKAEPADAEALNKYATFLWKARNDIWGAEETYLEAISADPANSVYSANYAHFLWNTGGEETCFPLDAPPQQNTT